MTIRIALAVAALAAMLAPPADTVAAAPGATAKAAARRLLDTDRRYGRTSPAIPGVEGIVRMFAKDVVIFAVPVPGFARGKAEAAAALERAIGSADARTEWTPIRVGVSADGSHGFSFGYMTSRTREGVSLPAKYVSYWTRTSRGWRVKLFKRVPRPEGEVSLTEMPPSLPVRSATVRADGPSQSESESSLRRREQDFSDQSQKIGLSAAFARFGAPDAVNVGGEAAFVVTPAEIAKIQPPTSPLRWSADQGVIVARSGDLGATWGYLRRTGPTPPGRLGQIPFFTIWRRAAPGESWYYVAE